MYNLKLVYSYDGSKYMGFQRQNNLSTVQGDIEKIFLKVFNEKINLISSGRTDKGVHAIAQTSNAIITKKINENRIKEAINKHLKYVQIKEVEYVDLNFHSRFSAKKRWYVYLFKKDVDVFHKDYISKIKDDIDINKFNELCKTFLGVHSFESFMKKNKDVTNYVRTIYEIHIEKKDDTYYLYICANAFLQSMVRIITQTLMETYFNNLDKEYILDKLNNNYLDKPKKLYDPSGLYLLKIDYEE